jgi:hypothetical protein
MDEFDPVAAAVGRSIPKQRSRPRRLMNLVHIWAPNPPAINAPKVRLPKKFRDYRIILLTK